MATSPASCVPPPPADGSSDGSNGSSSPCPSPSPPPKSSRGMGLNAANSLSGRQPCSSSRAAAAAHTSVLSTVSAGVFQKASAFASPRADSDQPGANPAACTAQNSPGSSPCSPRAQTTRTTAGQTRPPAPQHAAGGTRVAPAQHRAHTTHQQTTADLVSTPVCQAQHSQAHAAACGVMVCRSFTTTTAGRHSSRQSKCRHPAGVTHHTAASSHTRTCSCAQCSGWTASGSGHSVDCCSTVSASSLKSASGTSSSTV